MAYVQKFFKSLGNLGHTVTLLSYPRPTGHTTACYIRPASCRGQLVVSVHGGGNDLFYPQLQMFRALLEDGYEVFAFDLDGHGAGSSTLLSVTDFGPSMIADALEQAARTAEARQIHIVAHSLGAALAIAYLASHGGNSNVRSFVAISPLSELRIGALPVVAEALAIFSPSFYAAIPTYGSLVIPAFGSFRRHAFPIRIDDSARMGMPYWVVFREIVARLMAEVCKQGSGLTDFPPSLLITGGCDYLAGTGSSPLITGAVSIQVPWANHLTLMLSGAVRQHIQRWLHDLRIASEE